MCLLVSQPEGVVISNIWLADFYQKNSDGFGYMYAEGGVLYHRKVVGKFEDVAEAYRDVAGKACAFHFRMRTHGDIDMENCHPYPVLTEEDGYPIYMMHNGVLSTGNAKDVSKSDTWHYIQDYLRPLLLRDPELFLQPAFQKLVENHIGSSNKFILMDAYGNQAVLNKSSGVEWEANEGKPKAWMSNTYAWSASKAGVYQTWSGGFGGRRYWGGYAPWYDDDLFPSTPALPGTSHHSPTPRWIEEKRVKFFDLLRRRRLMRAWQKLSYADFADFAEAVGEDVVDIFMDEISDGRHDDAEIIREVEGVLTSMAEAKEKKEAKEAEEAEEAEQGKKDDVAADAAPDWAKDLKVYFFEALWAQGLSDAFNELDEEEVEAYMGLVGRKNSETLIAVIQAGGYDDDLDVIVEIRAALDEAAESETTH